MTNIPCLVDDMLATLAREHVPVRDRERERGVLPVRTMPATFEQKCYLSQNAYGLCVRWVSCVLCLCVLCVLCVLCARVLCVRCVSVLRVCVLCMCCGSLVYVCCVCMFWVCCLCVLCGCVLYVFFVCV